MKALIVIMLWGLKVHLLGFKRMLEVEMLLLPFLFCDNHFTSHPRLLGVLFYSFTSSALLPLLEVQLLCVGLYSSLLLSSIIQLHVIISTL